MAEAIWYYAVDDQEHGPITSAQLKALAASNGLKPDDLVWREGLDDWKPAREVSGLFTAGGAPAAARPAEPAAPPPAAPETPPAESVPPTVKSERPEMPASVERARVPALTSPQPEMHTAPSSPLVNLFEPLRFGRYVGQPLLLLGLVLVLLAKGCDSVGNRYVQQIQAKIELSENEFKDEWDAKRKRIEDRIAALRESDPEDDGARADLTGLNEELNILNEDLRKAREKLEEGAWQSLRKQARDATSGNKVWAYYREMVFVFGTIVLSVGLLAVGFTGEGAQKWICLIMLAIITFSLYVGGAAWIGALTNLIR